MSFMSVQKEKMTQDTIFIHLRNSLLRRCKIRLILRQEKTRFKTITRHKYTLSLIKGYEEYSKRKVRIMNIDLNFHNDFVNFLKDVHNYGNTTIEKQLSTIKQYVREASQKDIKLVQKLKVAVSLLKR